MEPRVQIGLILAVIGVMLVIAGIAVMFADRIPFLGRLPGDINVHGGNWSVHFPIMTCIVLSILLTILFNLFTRR